MTTIPLRAGSPAQDGVARSLGVLESVTLRSFTVRRLVKIALDFACGMAAVGLAVLLERPAGPAPAGWGLLAVGTGAVLVASHALGGSYRAIWRYTSLREAISTGVSSLAVLAALAIANAVGVVVISPTLAVLVTLFSVVLCAGLRTLRRWQVSLAKRGGVPVRVTQSRAGPHRVLIAGAGEHGLSIARDLLRSTNDGVTLAGFLDDDPAKIGAAPLGLPVLGPLADVLTIAERHQVNEIIVAMPSSAPDVVRGFVRHVEDSGLRVRTVGGVARFVRGAALHRPGQTTIEELLAEGSTGAAGAGGVRRVLVTGGAGYIGSHLTRMLLERGYHVRLLDRFDYGRAALEGIAGHPHLEVIAGDITSSRDLTRALKDVDGVIALAAIVGDPACNLYPDETVNLNYLSTKILVDACNFYGVRRLVFASSCSVYGSNNGGFLTEASRLNPVSLYARTRVLSENLLFDRRGDVEPVVLRLSTVFGLSPRMRFDLVVNTLTARAVLQHKIGVFGGNQWRPHVHCRDAARAFILALEAPAPMVAGEVFNVGGDASNLRIDALGELVAEIVGGVEVARHGDVADPRDYRVSFAKIRRVLGFEPEFSVARGIREVAAAVRANAHFQRFDDPVYHNVEAFKEAVDTPRRRRDDRVSAPVRQLAQA
ncbi:MAG TPA: NAD-dependent epimerase/dehydratase family protein [Gemmatimonadales bacterium]